MTFCFGNFQRALMRKGALFFRGLVLCIGLALAATVSHAAPSIPPGLIEQAKRLSPTEQRALAEQYGIALPATTSASMTPPAAEMQVSPLVQNRLSDEMTDSEAQAFIEDVIKSQAQEALPRFGSQLFSDDLEAYAPLDEALAPSGYLLGPGDELKIQIFGKDPIETLVQVDRGGQIIVPKIGLISLAGLTFEEAKRVIAQRVNTRVIGSEVVTSLGSLRQISIFLAGEVRAPGNYNVSALTSISQALYLSSGLTNIGSFRDIQVRRAGQVVAQFDLYDLLLKGKRDNDITLQSGDTVFVPVARGTVRVNGAVKRPARYDLKGGETFAEVIAMAGGFTATAYQQMSTIRRFDAEKGFPSILTVTDPMSDVPVQDGDALIANEGTTQLANAIELKGALVRPGVYAFSEGARASDYIGEIDRDLLPNADLEIALIVRRVNERLDVEVLAFDLVAAAQSPGSRFDPELQVFDQIIVLPIPRITSADLSLAVDAESEAKREADAGDKSEQTVSRKALIGRVVDKLRDQAGAGQAVALVSIQGAVKEPGEYPLTNTGDLAFLVQLAGGFEDGAFTKDVEVRRINVNEDRAAVEILNTSFTSEIPFSLQSRDVVRINYLPDWNPDAAVEVKGEVRFPGLYALRDGETIGSLISRAGGVSAEAFPEAARFTSKSTKDQQQTNARKLIKRFQRQQASRRAVTQVGGDPDGSTDEDYTDSLMASFQGRLVVDLPRILAGDASADVLLQDGDELVIPKLVESVTVAGEVYEPGSFRFEPGLAFTDYLELAAGITDRARKKDIYVIEPNGAVVALKNSKRQLFRFDRSVAGLSPGSVIVVPTNYDYEKPIDRYRSITSVVFESVASVAAFFSIAKK